MDASQLDLIILGSATNRCIGIRLLVTSHIAVIVAS